MKLANPETNGNGCTGYDPKGYNGWKNRQTWNVSLWINNDYALYTAAVMFMEKRKHPKANGHYMRFITEQGLATERTPENIAWVSTRLDYKALDDMMREMA